MTEKKLQLQSLRDFQILEQEIAGLEAAAEGIPKTLQLIEAEREADRAKQTDLEERCKDLERERVRREADIESWIASRLEASVGGSQEAEAGDAGPGDPS